MGINIGPQIAETKANQHFFPGVHGIIVAADAMEVAHENLEDYYKVLGEDTIQFIHFADGDPSGHYILGDGNYPLKEYIEILEKHNYTGIIDLEINDSIYWDDPHSSVERSVDYLKKNIFK